MEQLYTIYKKNIDCEKISLEQFNIINIYPLIDRLCQFKKLRVLNLSHNNINNLPDEISKLSQLTELNISDNPIIIDENLFNALNSIENLKSLNITFQDQKDQTRLTNSMKNLIYLNGENLTRNKLKFEQNVEEFEKISVLQDKIIQEYNKNNYEYENANEYVDMIKKINKELQNVKNNHFKLQNTQLNKNKFLLQNVCMEKIVNLMKNTHPQFQSILNNLCMNIQDIFMGQFDLLIGMSQENENLKDEQYANNSQPTQINSLIKSQNKKINQLKNNFTSKQSDFSKSNEKENRIIKNLSDSYNNSNNKENSNKNFNISVVNKELNYQQKQNEDFNSSMKKFTDLKSKSKNRYTNFKIENTKNWTIHQLRNFINNLLQSHDQQKEKSIINKAPLENMEMHMFNQISNKYGLPNLIEEQTRIITQAVSVQKKTDPWVQLFHLILNNQINEDQRQVLEEICFNIKKFLREQFQSKNKYQSAKIIEESVDKVANSTVNYEMIDFILTNLYHPSDHRFIINKIKSLLTSESTPIVSLFEESECDPVISQNALQNIILDWQIESNLRKFHNFNHLFNSVDKNGNGILMWEDLKEIFYILKVDSLPDYKEIVKRIKESADHSQCGYQTQSPLFNSFMTIEFFNHQGKKAVLMDQVLSLNLANM